MGDFIESLSQISVPTILVVAGIFFLFISMGGQLGTQIATDTIRRKYAGALGLVILISGISLYFVISVERSESGSSEEISERTYQFRANNSLSGSIIEERFKLRMPDVKLTIQSSDGKVKVRNVSIEQSCSLKREILSSLDGRPTTLRETTLSDVTITTDKKNDKEIPKTTEGIFTGHSVLMERKGGRWLKTLVGAEPTEQQQVELNAPYTDENEIYPAYPVKIGDTWSLDGAQLAHVVGAGNFLSVDGSATLKFAKIKKCRESDCAVIIVQRFELSGKMLVGGEIAKVSIGGHGTIFRSLFYSLDIERFFEGVISFEIEKMDGGKIVRSVFTSPIESNSIKKLIGG